MNWSVLILAAGRGPDDPMAKAFGVANKCLIPVAGVPMLKRVANAVAASGIARRTIVSIETADLALELLGDRVLVVEPAASAPGSVLAALRQGDVTYPLLVTTGDHALLTPAMIKHFCGAAQDSGADFCAGLATAETILAAYPESVRTFFTLGPNRVSGCNLFALNTEKSIALLERWQYLEQVRKKPWRLVAAFGISPLLQFLIGKLTLDGAFAIASRKLGLVAKPVHMPFAEAAIDVDKPADKDLAERILASRH